MKSADQFRPGPPPSLTTAIYARDYNETKDLGGAKSQSVPRADRRCTLLDPTQPRTRVAGGRTSIVGGQGADPGRNPRPFAVLNMGTANTYITDWDAKFTYNLWRPMTAIRNGDMDGNDATERDAGWTPLNTTPMHPEYPSQAAIQSGAALAVLESVFGAGSVVVVTATDTVDPRLDLPQRSPPWRKWAKSKPWCASGAASIFGTLSKSANRWAARSASIYRNYLTPAR